MVRRVTQFFRNAMLSGFAVLVPLGLTAYILQMITSTADRLVDALPNSWHAALPLRFPGAGLLVAACFAFVVGVVVRNLIGRHLMQGVTSLIERIPLVASIYKLLRQISEAFLGGGGNGFKRVVLVEWPREGAWTLAFVTSDASGQIQARLVDRHKTNDQWLNLFVPTTPNPTSGFYFVARESDCLATTLSIEAAFKVIISGGALPAEDAPAVATPRRLKAT